MTDERKLFVCGTCGRLFVSEAEILAHQDTFAAMHRLDPEIDEHDGEPWSSVVLHDAVVKAPPRRPEGEVTTSFAESVIAFEALAEKLSVKTSACLICGSACVEASAFLGFTTPPEKFVCSTCRSASSRRARRSMRKGNLTAAAYYTARSLARRES